MPTIVNGLDELKQLAGKDLGSSDWLEIGQDRVDTFADATGDRQWIHVDPVRAKAGPFGGTIAHGYLTLALVIPLWTEMLRIDGIRMAVNYGANKVRFPAPVPVGAKIRLHAVVLSVENVAGPGVQLTAALTVQCEGSEKPAAVVEAVYRYYA